MSINMVKLTAIPGIPLVKPDDDLAGILINTLDQTGIEPGKQDVLVVAQKIVSKA